MQSELTNEAAREAGPLCLSGVLRDECIALDGSAPPFDPQATESARLKAIIGHVDQFCAARSALCLSGGGIRSATFAFGVIQRLAQAGLLTKFDFLSSVSGGGYLGSFLSAWAKAHPDRQAGVEKDLASVSNRPIEEPEPKPVRHLRRFSNYVAPSLGLFSADTWTLVATALRNLFLNWSVLVVGMAAVLVIPWFGLLGVLGIPTSGQLFILLGMAFLCFAVASGYPGLDLPSFENCGLKQRWFLGFWLAPLFLGIICLVTCWAGVTNGNPRSLILMAMPEAVMLIRCFFVLAGLLGILLAMGIAVWRKRKTLRAYVPALRFRRTLFVALLTIAFFAYPIPYFIQVIALKLFPAPAGSAVKYMMLAPALLLFAFATLNALFVGLTSRCFDDDDREWWARAAGWLGAVILGWLAVHALLFYAPMLLETLSAQGQTAIAASGGILGYLCARIGSSGGTSVFLRNNSQAIKTAALSLAAFIFFAMLACGISRALDAGFFNASLLDAVPAEELGDREAWLALLPGNRAQLLREAASAAQHFDLSLPAVVAPSAFQHFGLLLSFPEFYWKFADRIFVCFAALVGIAGFMGFFVNVNRFSLHASYRNRLVRCYLGAARADVRDPHPFTGFDPQDNFQLCQLCAGRPLHLINMTLNLVNTKELAWQERQADSFTATRLHVGNARLGYRSASEYASGVTLGTVMAISGAAANPNQGYHSSPLVTFLMTLFNLRLGWWLGNPARDSWLGRVFGRLEPWRLRGPGHALPPLFAEALGLTSDRRPYINLSDGGHFENLGLYEMVRRRCRFIVVIDAEQDTDYSFEGLGNAVRKIRIDMGVRITFEGLGSVSKAIEAARRNCWAFGTIHYGESTPGVSNGRLLYIKPLLRDDEPTDVINYARNNGDFPHETTGDQFFSESQFESYRSLGWHQMDRLIDGRTVATIVDLFATPAVSSDGGK